MVDIEKERRRKGHWCVDRKTGEKKWRDHHAAVCSMCSVFLDEIEERRRNRRT